MRKFISVAGFGAILGTAIASWLAPPFLVWWWTPPTDLPLSCKKAVAWTASSLLVSQAVGLFIGGFIALLVRYGLFGRKKDHPTAVDLSDIEELK